MKFRNARFLPGGCRGECWRKWVEATDARIVRGGFWNNDQMVSIIGNRVVTLDTYCEPIGRAVVTYTRLRAYFVNLDGVRFRIYRSNFLSKIARWIGKRGIVTGDPVFDDAFIVQANDPAKIRSVLAAEKLRTMIEDEPTVRLEVKYNVGWLYRPCPDGMDELCLQVSGIVTDVGRLKGLHALFISTLYYL